MFAMQEEVEKGKSRAGWVVGVFVAAAVLVTGSLTVPNLYKQYKYRNAMNDAVQRAPYKEGFSNVDLPGYNRHLIIDNSSISGAKVTCISVISVPNGSTVKMDAMYAAIDERVDPVRDSGRWIAGPAKGTPGLILNPNAVGLTEIGACADRPGFNPELPTTLQLRAK